MCVGAAKTREHHLATDLLAVLLAQEEQVRRVEHPHAAVANRHARGNVQPIGKDRNFVSAPVGVRVFENLYSITTDAGRLARVLDALSDPDAPAIVESHRDGIDDVRFTGDEFDGEAFRHRHFAEGFLWRVRLVRRLVLAPRCDAVGLRAENVRRHHQRQRKGDVATSHSLKNSMYGGDTIRDWCPSRSAHADERWLFGHAHWFARREQGTGVQRSGSVLSWRGTLIRPEVSQ